MATNPWSPAVINFDRVRRNTTSIRFQFDDEAGVGIDNTGFTYKMEGSHLEDPNAEAPRFELTGSGDGTGGVVFAITDGDQMDPAEDSLFYDVEQTDGGGKTRTVVRGEISFLPNVTDSEEV